MSSAHTDQEVDFIVTSPAHQSLVLITSQVQKAIEQLNIQHGVVHLFMPHTTCGLLINEAADPHVAKDVLQRLEEMVPWISPHDRHGEGNTAAHVRSCLIGCSLTIPVRDKRLRLGSWQGVFLADFDGPRSRHVIVTAL